jgi:uncharacterized protein
VARDFNQEYARLRAFRESQREIKSLAARAVQQAPSTLDFPFEVKTVDGGLMGVFEGYLSTFGNEDAYSDVVDPGAFTNTIKAAKASGRKYLWPILYQHDPSDPIGGWVDAKEDSRGLWVRGELDLEVPQGARAYSGMKKRYVTSLSIGYDTVSDEYDKQHRRHLKEIRLWEGSVVTLPTSKHRC